MKKRVFLFIVLAFYFCSFLVSAQETQNYAELEQIIKDSISESNNNIIKNFNNILEQKLSIYKTPDDSLKQIVYDTMKEERLKISVSVFSGVFLALMLYAFIRFLFRKREKDVLEMDRYPVYPNNLIKTEIPTIL
jgi:hypothetical protein